MLVAASAALAPELPDHTRTHDEMSQRAIHKYVEVHNIQELPYVPVHDVSYRHIPTPELVSDAMQLARGPQGNGGLFIGWAHNRLPSEQAVYFSTLVRPDDPLGHRMGLIEKIALVLWRKARFSTAATMINIDTIQDMGAQWDFQPLEHVFTRTY